MKQEENEIPEFKYCTVCGSKIGFLRRIISKKLDKKRSYHLTQRQFCTPRCAKIGIKILSELSMVRDEERGKIANLLDYYISDIIDKRRREIQKYGSMQNIPRDVVLKLNPGSLSILREIRSRLDGPKKKESKFGG